MAVLTIQAPSCAPLERAPAVGIDLGTTHSLIALYRHDGIEVLGADNGEVLLPSVVRYCPNNDVIVGSAAKAAFQDDPDNTIVSAKRLLGHLPNLTTRAGTLSPIDVSAEILKSLMERAHKIDPAIDQAVITVPAYFDETQRQATKKAAELAGIKVLRLLNEPTAAAIAYGLDNAATGTCLVFDLGGGTFDVSLLHLNKGLFEVVATGGDTALGGDDMDQLVMSQTGLPLMCARAAKECLSLETSTTLALKCGKCVKLTRDELNTLIEPLVTKMLKICQQVLRDAKILKDNIDQVILVGGATRVPLIQERVEAFFGKKPLCDLDPDKVVAMGAAVQASILSGHKRSDDMLLLDVTPLSLGVEMMGGLVEKIILRNTPIPAVASELFTTYADGQTGLSLHVVQGEREGVEDCRSLAHFDLNGIPPMPAGKARIEVTFKIDADGLLTVEAKELTSGVRSEITVKPSYGLTEKEVVECVEGSLLNQKDDLAKRKLRQKITAAKQLFASVEKGLNQNSRLLSSEEHMKLLEAQDQLLKAIEQSDFHLIANAVSALEPLASLLAERQLNDALRIALAGKSVDDIETVLL